MRHFPLITAAALAGLELACTDNAVPTAANETLTLGPKVSDKFHSHGRGTFAFANFSEEADPPCLQTGIFINEASQQTQTATGIERTTEQLSVTGMAGDVCGAGTSFIFSAPVDEALSFDERGNLDRATLHGTIIATDVTSGTLVPARVALVWTGTGPLESSVSRSRSNDQFMFYEQTKVISRNAVVTGTLFVSGQNLVFRPSGFAGLGRTRADTLQIVR